MNVKEEVEIFLGLVRSQSMIPVINEKATFPDPRMCGAIVSEEYRRGQIRVHIGNVFAGIPRDAEKIEFASLEDLFATWRVD